MITLEMTLAEAKTLRRALLVAEAESKADDEILTDLYVRVQKLVRTPRGLPAPRPEDCLLRGSDANIYSDSAFFHDAATCRTCVEDATQRLNHQRITAHLRAENVR